MYQMPNFELPIVSIAQNLTETQIVQPVFSTEIGKGKVYGQPELNFKASKNCNFNIICGETISRYRFRTGLCGITDMSPKFKIISIYLSATFLIQKMNDQVMNFHMLTIDHSKRKLLQC